MGFTYYGFHISIVGFRDCAHTRAEWIPLRAVRNEYTALQKSFLELYVQRLPIITVQILHFTCSVRSGDSLTQLMFDKAYGC